jgi:hypothetical protein
VVFEDPRALDLKIRRSHFHYFFQALILARYIQFVDADAPTKYDDFP